MNKKVLLIVIITILVLSYGCGSKKGGKRGKQAEEDFRRGTQGLELEFWKLQRKIFAQDDIREDDELIVYVDVRNKGAFPQPEEVIGDDLGELHISGFDKSILDFRQVSISLRKSELEGKNAFNPEGTRVTKKFEAGINLVGKNIDAYPTTLLVTACYNYKTEASIPVCIDPDPYGISPKDKVCTIPASYSGGTQGAPVAVTKVEQEVLSNRMQFKIYIKNSGSGDVIKKDELRKCDPWVDYQSRLKREDLDLVFVQEVSVSGTEISFDCKPYAEINGYFRLIDGSGFIICDFNNFDKATPAYSTPLVIKLVYVYRDAISQDVEIIRVPT